LVGACPISQEFKSDLFITLKTARHVITAERHRSQVSVDAAGMEEDSFEMNTRFAMVNHRTPAVAWRRAGSWQGLRSNTDISSGTAESLR